jgi:hypothetical protein
MTWKMFRELQDAITWRFGYFSTAYLTRQELYLYQEYLIADTYIRMYSKDTCKNVVDSIPRSLLCILSDCTIRLIKADVEKNIPDVYFNYTLNELKAMCYKNHVIYVGNKRYKMNWIRAYIRCQSWGFNVFALRNTLNEDTVRYIYTFLKTE